MSKLSDRMWVTRKARINMEKRLLLMSNVYTYLIPWYSIIIIALSLFPNKIESSLRDSISIFSSVFVLVASLVLSQRDLKQECTKIKKQYIKLGKLTTDTKNAEDKSNDTSQFEKKYNKLLFSTGNHSENDFRKVKIECRMRKNNNPDEQYTVPLPSGLDYLIFFLSYLVSRFVIILLFISPILLYIWLK